MTHFRIIAALAALLGAGVALPGAASAQSSAGITTCDTITDENRSFCELLEAEQAALRAAAVRAATGAIQSVGRPGAAPIAPPPATPAAPQVAAPAAPQVGAPAAPQGAPSGGPQVAVAPGAAPLPASAQEDVRERPSASPNCPAPSKGRPCRTF